MPSPVLRVILAAVVGLMSGERLLLWLLVSGFRGTDETSTGVHVGVGSMRPVRCSSWCVRWREPGAEIATAPRSGRIGVGAARQGRRRRVVEPIRFVSRVCAYRSVARVRVRRRAAAARGGGGGGDAHSHAPVESAGIRAVKGLFLPPLSQFLGSASEAGLPELV